MQRFFRLVGTYGVGAIMVALIVLGAVTLYGNSKGYPAACQTACVAQGYDEATFVVSVSEASLSCECRMKVKVKNIPLPEGE